MQGYSLICRDFVACLEQKHGESSCSIYATIGHNAEGTRSPTAVGRIRLPRPVSRGGRVLSIQAAQRHRTWSRSPFSSIVGIMCAAAWSHRVAASLCPGKSLVLIVAAGLALGIGLAHSVLGEKYILIRLFRQPLPRLFGSDRFTRRTLRFAWHLTTIAWCGLAAIMILVQLGDASRPNLLNIVGATFGVTAVTALIASHGKHLSWIVFGTISFICFVAAPLT